MNARLLCLPMLLLLALAGCTRAGDQATDPSTSTPAPSALEPITEGAVAVLVSEHLGAENVRSYGSYGPERDAVGVMVRLRGGSPRDMFAVTVYGPDHPEARAAGGGPGGGCGPFEKGGPGGATTRCVELAGDGIATVLTTPYGFSDDNARGSVLMGGAYSPGAGMALAMYESYAERMPVDEDAMLQLMSDPRLGWLTEPELNEAGEEVVVRRLEG